MNRYDLAVFDLDGTLLDTREGVIHSVKYTIEKMGFEMISDEELSSFIGPPVQASFARIYGLEGPILQEIATTFRNNYKLHENLFRARAYDGIFELFAELRGRGITPAVATFKREDTALDVLRHFGFDKYTDVMFGGDHENKLTKRDIIEKCLTYSGVTDKSRAVMIGDTHFDAVGAEEIGVDFIGVTYGFGFKSAKDVVGGTAIGSADTALDILKFF